jgi:hypothetical protein
MEEVCYFHLQDRIVSQASNQAEITSQNTIKVLLFGSEKVKSQIYLNLEQFD